MKLQMYKATYLTCRVKMVDIDINGTRALVMVARTMSTSLKSYKKRIVKKMLDQCSNNNQYYLSTIMHVELRL